MSENQNPEPEKSLEWRLEEILYAKLGTDYRRDLSLTVRADALSWVFKMAVWGLAARTKAFRETPREKREATDAASLGSFEIDLEAMLSAIEKADVVPLPAKKISGVGRQKKGGAK